MNKLYIIMIVFSLFLSCSKLKKDIVIDILQDDQGQYDTNCYLIENDDSSLLYKTYNPVEVDTVLMKGGRTFYVLKEDLTTEEASYKYLIYDDTKHILYGSSDIFAIFDSISQDDIETIFNNSGEIKYKADDIDLKSNCLRIKYMVLDTIKYKYMNINKLGIPPYIRE